MNEINLDVVNTVRFKLGGNSIDVSKPNYGQSRAFREKLQDKSIGEEDAMIDLLQELGMSKEILLSFNDEQIKMVVSAVFPETEKKTE